MAELTPVPTAIEPGLAPGGVVFRQLAPDGAIITESRVVDLVHAEAVATRDALTGMDVANVVLATYDGDSGELMAIIRSP